MIGITVLRTGRHREMCATVRLRLDHGRARRTVLVRTFERAVAAERERVQRSTPSGDRPSRYRDAMELGVHFALSDRVAAELLDARGDDDRLGAVVEDIEETGRAEFSCDTDKAWDPILCTLSNAGYRRAPEEWPAYGVILGDEDLNTDTDDQLITHLGPDRVAEVAAHLAGVTEAGFGAGYDAMPLDHRNPEYGASERAYAWSWLQEVTHFFRRAARDGRHVVFTVRF